MNSREHTCLSDLNILIIKEICKQLKYNPCFYQSSAFCIGKKSDDRLIELINILDGKSYLSGYGASRYQSLNKFKEAEIDLNYYSFKAPIYPQLWQDFIPNLSILDVLFNIGFEKTSLIIKS